MLPESTHSDIMRGMIARANGSFHPETGQAIHPFPRGSRLRIPVCLLTCTLPPILPPPTSSIHALDDLNGQAVSVHSKLP